MSVGRERSLPPPPPTDMPAGRLFARLARLEAAIAARDAEALRVARWMARRRAMLRVRPVRTVPVRPWGLAPGLGSSALDRMTRDRIRYAAFAAQAALYEDAWNSS
jgi:hypothetical protein